MLGSSRFCATKSHFSLRFKLQARGRDGPLGRKAPGEPSSVKARVEEQPVSDFDLHRWDREETEDDDADRAVEQEEADDGDAGDVQAHGSWGSAG